MNENWLASRVVGFSGGVTVSAQSRCGTLRVVAFHT